MYRTRVIDIQEKERFNCFVAGHPKGHFLQIWEWGQVKQGMGWESIPIVLEKDGDIRGALLILKRMLPVPGLKKCIFYAPRGPVADLDNEEENRLLFKGAEKIARQHGAIFLKVDPDVSVDRQEYALLLGRCGFKHQATGLNFEGVQPNFVFRLDLTLSPEKLLANMHNKWRYNIRLAQKKGVTVRLARDKEDLQVFYTILQETASRDEFMVRGYEYFEWIWDYMVSHGFASIFLAEYDGQIVAGTLAMILGAKAWYLYGASSNQHRNVMPNYLLQWEMILWAQAQGCTLYDFRGVSGDLDESNPLYGLYRFKKGFNPTLTEFVGEWDYVYSPFWYLLWTKVLPLYLERRRGLRKHSTPQEVD